MPGDLAKRIPELSIRGGDLVDGAAADGDLDRRRAVRCVDTRGDKRLVGCRGVAVRTEPAMNGRQRQKRRLRTEPDGGSVARPRPLLSRFAEARADRVADDVSDGLHLTLGAAHDPRPIPSLEHMALACMGGVELLCMPAIDPMHRFCEIR